MRQRDRGPRGEVATSLSQGLAQVGHSLRRARVSQGLAVPDAARAAGMSPEHVEALEAGDPTHLPDQVQTVNLLRRYAQSLGLPADRYALALLDAWPEISRPGPPGAGAVPTQSVPLETGPPSNGQPWSQAPTGALPATPGAGHQAPGEPTGVFPAHGEGPPTGRQRAAGAPYDGLPSGGHPTAATPRAGESGPYATGQVPAFVQDTGPIPAVPGGAHAAHSNERGRGGVLLLRVLVGLLVVLVLAAGAALAVDHFKPQWFRSIQKSSSPGSTGAATPTTPTVASAADPAISGPVNNSSTSATITVHGSGARVRVSAVGGPSWVEVTTPSQTNPIFANDIAGGAAQTFTIEPSMKIQVGSAAAHLDVMVGNATSKTIVPSVAPFTYQFQQH